VLVLVLLLGGAIQHKSLSAAFPLYVSLLVFC
jgi:hypothetical protein